MAVSRWSYCTSVYVFSIVALYAYWISLFFLFRIKMEFRSATTCIKLILMRKLKKMTEIWKLSTNVRKTNHILSRFLEEWRNVVAWMLYGPRSIWYRYYTFCYGQYESQKKDILKNIHSSCKKINFFSQFSGNTKNVHAATTAREYLHAA